MRQIILIMTLAASSFADRFEWNTYYFEDDRDNSVYTSSFSFLKTLWKSTRLVFDAELDQVTIAPIIDGTSGATRPAIQKTESLKKNRGQFIFGIQQDLGLDHKLSVQGYLSRESDYQSQTVSGSYTSRWAKQNFIVAITGQYNFDRVGHIAEDYTYSEQNKETFGAGLKLSQNISRSVVLSLKGDWTRLEGFLADPYRKVTALNGVEYNESRPSQRDRFAFGSFLKLGMPFIDAVLDINHRYYFDMWTENYDWGVESNTFSFKIGKRLSENLIFNINYRYYDQEKAFFFKDQYLGHESYKTADYKLNSFESQNFGSGINYKLSALADFKGWRWLETCNVEVNYFHYINTLQFSGDILEVALVTEF
jgi:hypothetical protein